MRAPSWRGPLSRRPVFNIPTTSLLIEMLGPADKTLRRLCGWQRAGRGAEQRVDVFSGHFRGSRLCATEAARGCNEALIQDTHSDSFGRTYLTMTARRSRPGKNRAKSDKPAPEPKPKLKRWPSPQGESSRPPPPPSRIERQRGMTLAAMLADLPRACDVGAKRNAKGFSETWIGYKLHIDTADSEIPISCVLTAASVHDSRVAIPLATITAGRVTNLYDLMDSA